GHLAVHHVTCFVDLDLLAADVKTEQVEQVVVGGRGAGAEDTLAGLVAGQIAHRAQARNVAEQLGNAVGQGRVVQRADVDVDFPFAFGHRLGGCGGGGCGGRRGNG